MIALCLLLAAASPQRVALLVGSNDGVETDVHLRYAESDAEKMAKALRDLGSFGAHQIRTLQGGTAEDLRNALDALPREQATVLFYYSGHGDAESLHVGGTLFPIAELEQRLQALQASVTVTVIDACKSGAMTRTKGATLGPAYDISVNEDAAVSGRVVIASSAADEAAQESDAIEGSFFTHYWVSGLYGRADANSDGLVTLEEAYRFAHFETIAHTIQSRAGVQHPSYKLALAGEGNLVLANLSLATAQLDVEVQQGSYFVLDRRRQLVLAELVPSETGVASIRLPPGVYRLKKRERGRILMGEVALAAGKKARVSDDDMRAVGYEVPAKKGLSIFTYGPTALFGVRNGISSGMTATFEARAGMRLSWSWFSFEPRFAFRNAAVLISPTTPGTAYYSHQEYDPGFSLLGTWSRGRVGISAGADLGIVFFGQRYVAATTARTTGFETSDSTGNSSNSPQPSAEPAASVAKGSFTLPPMGFQGALMAQLSVRLFWQLHAVAYGTLGFAAFSEAATPADPGTSRLAFIGSGGLGVQIALH